MILWKLVKIWQAYCCTDEGGLKINNNLPGICSLALFSTRSNSTRQSRQLWNCPSVSTADKSCHTKGADFPLFIHFSRWCLSWNRDGTIVRWKGQSSKGTCQKRFSGFCPLRGGRGYPPFPLRKKSFFFSHWFSVQGVGGGGTPLTEKIR